MILAPSIASDILSDTDKTQFSILPSTGSFYRLPSFLFSSAKKLVGIKSTPPTQTIFRNSLNSSLTKPEGYNKLSQKFATSALRNTCNVSGSLFSSSLTVASGFANCAAIAAVPIINHTPYLGTMSQTSTGKLKDVSDLRDTIINTTEKILQALPFAEKFVGALSIYQPHERKGAEDDYLNGFHVYSSGELSEDLSFSFSGCGWLIFYELGVAQCLCDTIKPDILRKAKFLGSSTGSIIALCLALNLDLEMLREKLMELVQESSANLLSPFVAISNIIRPLLEKLVHRNIDMCRDRLFISLTELPSGKNVLLSQFSSRTVLGC
ncbi:hypothetical protein HK103_000426 [Boothiomyces macroporosus]|uniref:PNPLA domain-containing protein n=1 Tax=Boothiomyces macroporosus TaxID=261099 RepID=A0AAD5UF81_9FUNG|nr:hypothetical protein HK103_000426 [Boothiomyces macroporosus]